MIYRRDKKIEFSIRKSHIKAEKNLQKSVVVAAPARYTTHTNTRKIKKRTNYNCLGEADHLVATIPGLSNFQLFSVFTHAPQRQQVQNGLVVDLQHTQGDGVGGGLLEALDLVEQFLDGTRGHTFVRGAAFHSEGLARAGLSVGEDAHVVAV